MGTSHKSKSDDELKELAADISENGQRNPIMLDAEGMGSKVPETRSKVANFQVRRPDTSQYATLNGLATMAGVGVQRLRRLILKEVVDNALDEMDRPGRRGSVTVRRDGDDTYTVEDEGGGIPQDDLDKLRDLFSAHRSMVSGKFLRVPSRGVLGNGLRVLASAVALSKGTIIVESHGQRTELRPQRIGDTEVVSQVSAARERGTQITFTLDAEIILRDDDDLTDANAAISLAKASGPAYKRPPSPHWLDLDYLAQTFTAIEPNSTTVRQLIETLDGCSGAMAGRLAAPFGKGRTCRSMREAEIAELLGLMQERARVVNARLLGPIGTDAFGDDFNGYAVAEAEFSIRAHQPHAHIPVLIEAWASVTSHRGGDATLEVYCNRTPVVANTYAGRGKEGVWISGAGLRNALMEVKGGDCDLIVAVTAPFIPTTSSGKAPDLSLLESEIVDALRKAFNRSSRKRLPPDPQQPKPPKAEPLTKKPKLEPYQPSGRLAKLHAEEAERAGVKPADLLVLSRGTDPFDETRAIRHKAEWFAKQVERFLRKVKAHLRGMYYRCMAAGDVRDPDGRPFVGSEANANLVESAGKYARYLGLVPFDQIIDERAASPERFTLLDEKHADATDDPIRRELIVSDGDEPLEVPELDLLLPTLSISAPETPRQPYRIIMIGEKTSLGDVLKPIAEEVHGDLLLATGEVSEAQVHEICQRAAEDGRPLIILYFCDFDPAGGQMPVSVARKVQAHCYLEFPDLKVQVIRVALTIDQVIEFSLPDSPIKSTEKRAKRWFKKWGRQQVEIDSLATLRPEVLDKIVRDAVARYFDFNYERRYAKVKELSKKQLNWFLNQPAYRKAKASVEQAYQPVVEAMAALDDARTAAIAAMQQVVDTKGADLPDIVVTPKLNDDKPKEDDIVFDSNDNYGDATRKLRRLKGKDDDDDDDDDPGDADE